MTMAKVICEEVVNGETVLRSYTTASTTPWTLSPAVFVKTHPGVGKKFWCWQSVPTGTIIGADFTNAPEATSVTSQNQALIDGITTTPEEVLVYAAE